MKTCRIPFPLLIACLCLLTSCQKEEIVFQQDAINFLNNQHQILKLEDPNIPNFNLLQEDLEQHLFFFSGESHAVAANFDLEFELFTYLYTNAGVRNYIIENSYSNILILNQYLATGDENILDDLHQSYAGSFLWNKNGFAFWQKMYAFLQDIPREEWPLFVGVDIEHQISNALKMLEALLPGMPPPPAAEAGITKLLNGDKNSYESMWAIGNTLKSNISANPSSYEIYLGDQFFDFNFIVQNIINHQQAFAARDNFFGTRDLLIFENFLDYFPRFKSGKFFGQWGSKHVLQGYQKEGDSFSRLLQHNGRSPVQNQVLSILYLYQDCQFMSNTTFTSTPLPDFNSFGILEQYTRPQQNVLFKITGIDSPYEQQLIWNLNDPEVPDRGNTTSHYQYILVIDGAGAAVAYQ